MKSVLLSVLLLGATSWAGPGPFGIATIAGTPYDPSGDGGQATLAANSMSGIAFRDGNLYLTDGARVRKIAPNGIIQTVLGRIDPVVHQPIPGFSGDGGPALAAQLRGAVSLDFDSAGNFYIADAGNSCIRKVTARVVGGVAQPLDGTETITTYAGSCTLVDNSGDGGPSTSARLNQPRGIAIDPASGALYIADQSNNNVRKVAADGTITTIAGTGAAGFSGDGGPATSARLNLPTGITADPATGDVYIADALNSRVRKVAAGVITTVAGTGISSAVGGLNEGGAAVAANVRPMKVRLAGSNLLVLDSGVGTVRKIDGAGIITTLAGIGLTPYSGAFPPLGDGGPALAASMGAGPSGVQDFAFDGAGGLFVADASSKRVRFIANASSTTVFAQAVTAGNIATVAGPPGIVTFSGDSGPAASARLFEPRSLVFDPAEDLYLSDVGNNRVRKIDPARAITTIAGTGVAGFSGVPGPATAAQIQPASLAYNVDSLNLTNNDTRILNLAGNALTVVANTAGVPTPPSPDGTLATLAHMGAESIAFDTTGNLYVGDRLNFRIWKVDTTGIVKTVVGGGAVVVDGTIVLSATATQARLFGPASIAFDPSGNLYTVDGSRNRILKITAHGFNQPLDGTETVTIFGGTGGFGFSGDGGQASAAMLNSPDGLSSDADGNLYFNDGANFRIRKIDTNGVITTIAGTGVAGFSGDGGLATSAQIRGGPLAFDSLGNLFMSDSVNNVVRILDNTPPTVTYSGNLGTYTVDQTVAMTCNALDAGSGVATTTCANINGAAYSFGLGIHPYSATATDRAGNIGSGSTSFTVISTFTSLSNLVNQFETKPALAANMIATLQGAQAAFASGNIKSGDNQLNAFINQVNAQSGKSLTAAQAAVLIQCAMALMK